MGKLPFIFTAEKLDRNLAALGLDRTTDTESRRALALESRGLAGIKALGCSRYRVLSPHLPEHIHPDCIEINFCQNGSLVLEKNGSLHELKPGNVFITKPSDRHRLMKNAKGLFMYWLIVQIPPASATRQLLDLPKGEARALIQRLLNLPNTTFAAGKRTAEYFRQLFRICDRGGRNPLDTLRLRSLLVEVLLDLVDYGNSPVTVNHFVRIDEAIRTLREHPERQHDIQQLAERSGLSKARFTQLFKQATGFPPHAYLVSCRVTRARELALTTERPLAEIARQLGFSSPRHLATAFRETFGLAPSMLRRRQTSPGAQGTERCQRRKTTS